MKGGFNKILRNIVAGSSDTEFEKVSKPNIQSLFDIFVAIIEANKSYFPP